MFARFFDVIGDDAGGVAGDAACAAASVALEASAVEGSGCLAFLTLQGAGLAIVTIAVQRGVRHRAITSCGRCADRGCQPVSWGSDLLNLAGGILQVGGGEPCQRFCRLGSV